MGVSVRVRVGVGARVRVRVGVNVKVNVRVSVSVGVGMSYMYSDVKVQVFRAWEFLARVTIKGNLANLIADDTRHGEFNSPETPIQLARASCICNKAKVRQSKSVDGESDSPEIPANSPRRVGSTNIKV